MIYDITYFHRLGLYTFHRSYEMFLAFASDISSIKICDKANLINKRGSFEEWNGFLV